MILPIEKGDIKITSKYGERSLYGTLGFHSGLDIVGVSSDNVVSVTNGTVLWSQMVTDKNNPTWEWGNYVAVMGDDGCTLYYCHLDIRKVTKGDKVKAGDIIGVMGNTGYSFGKHLHFEVRPKNISAVNSADYLHLPNTVTEIAEKEYYADEICAVCGFTSGTRAYMNGYAWSADLWRKLAVSMRKQNGKCDRDEVITRCGFLPHTVKYIDDYKFASDFWRKIGERM